MGQLINIEKNSLIAASHNGTLPDIKPFQKEIFVLNTHIAGMNFMEDYAEIIRDIKEGNRLELFREPDNEHDELAIELIDGKGRKIGYVPRINNPVIARLMDAGKYFYAVVKPPRERPYEWRMDIYMED